MHGFWSKYCGACYRALSSSKLWAYHLVVGYHLELTFAWDVSVQKYSAKVHEASFSVQGK